jgi:Type I phosphodiesterase / nucleotide pyrophosphatase
MKSLIAFVLCIFTIQSNAQSNQPSPNIFIITTDGFRWQEIFNGADSIVINNPAYVNDTALLNQMYWDNDVNERRRMLMPFVWQTLAKKGSLYGNRNYENKVSVANAYRFSYAGYNEILTGYADPYIISNSKKWNNNENLLEFLNSQPEYENKVAAFTSWNLFEYILNRKAGNIYLNSGYEAIKHDSLTDTEMLFNDVQENAVFNIESTRNDMLTFVAAKEYIQTKHPKVVFIGFGETDEYAHGGHYDEYLQSAHLFDEYLARLWYLVNKDPFYKNNTSFIITTDHGRGKKSNTWKRHDLVTAGSASSWLMTIGPAFESSGEVKVKSEIFSNQLAKTIAGILGYQFNPPHPVGDALSTSAINKK